MPETRESLIAALASATCASCAQARLTLVWERTVAGRAGVLTRSESICGCQRVLREIVVLRIVHPD